MNKFKAVKCSDCVYRQKSTILNNYDECEAYTEDFVIGDIKTQTGNKFMAFSCNTFCKDVKKHKWCFRYMKLR